MKYYFALRATLFFLTNIVCANNLFAEAAIIEAPAGFEIAHAQAASDSPFVVVHDGGLAFWLFDAEDRSFKPISKNTIGDWDHRLNHIQWSENRLVLFRGWEGFIEILNPDNMSTHASFPADIKSASFRMSYWLDDSSILIDETDFYRNIDGTLTKDKQSNPAHTVQTGLIIHANQRVITSGFFDESINVWSLPEGNLLHTWEISTWFGKRQITAIALSYGRLLVGTQSGHLEERSLETGKKLWSARPCREPLNFYYSSQFFPSRSLNVDDGLFFSCGARIGYIEPRQKSWQIFDFKMVLKDAVAESHQMESATGTHHVANTLIAVETIPHSAWAVLIFTDGSSILVDKKQMRVVKKLENVKAGSAPVTYIAATRQIFLANTNGRIHLYPLAPITTETLPPPKTTDQTSR